MAARIALAVIIIFLSWAWSIRAESQTLSVTRKPFGDKDFEWLCLESSGALVSGHTRQDKAQESCSNAAIKNPGKTYRVSPGSQYEVVAQDFPVGVSPDASAGVWTWKAPTTLADGTPLKPEDLSHYNLWRQVGSETPTVYTQIDSRTSKLVWRMGSDGYGACFWMTAVRKNGLESRESNKVCMNLKGQPN